jgi:hypothetical protein
MSPFSMPEKDYTLRKWEPDDFAKYRRSNKLQARRLSEAGQSATRAVELEE